MFLTLRKLYPVVKLPFGKQVWVEKSEIYLPKGGKKLDYGFKFFAGFFMCAGIFTYIYIQADLNPDSVYGRLYKKYITDGLNALQGTEEDMLDPNRIKPPM
uniref:Uncharacterized protein n=1 Tax=Panagrolaimus sp. PS1159 TaxID=55785 RepID=A0AC35FAK3_9BILA